MYIYTKPASAPRIGVPGLSGLGTDRYIPAKNIDPATGQPMVSSKYPAPWAVAEVGLRNINCRFYQDAPRELVLSGSMPYTMEISVPGHNFIGSCHPRQECPEEIHQGADPKDPWRIRQCKEWRDQWNQEAANIIADPGFRANITERVLDVAGIQRAGRLLTDQAEFLEVVQEREAREKPIKLLAFIFLAGAGGILTFNAVRKYANNRAKRKKDAVEFEENSKGTYRKHFPHGSRKEVSDGWVIVDRPRPWEIKTESQCEKHGFEWVPARCR